MGWSGGSTLMSEVIAAVKSRVKGKKDRQAIYEDLIPAFEGLDADTLSECRGEDPAYDDALKATGNHDDEDDE